jgi:predicted RNA methylase
MSTDSYYTPADLADELVQLLPQITEGLIVDPAMGEGALLHAARSRFGEAVSLAGIDIDPVVVRAAERNGLLASRANFLSQPARNSTTAWRAARAQAGAVLLNPPFSTRGMAGQPVSFAGKIFNVGPALHFLLTCLQETQPNFGFAAILPAGAVEADRYAALWRLLADRYALVTKKVSGSDRFSGARVTAYLMYLSEKDGQLSLDSQQAVAFPGNPGQQPRCVEAIRGRFPVHLQRKFDNADGVRFLHSTDLGAPRKPASGGSKLGPAHLAIEGPFFALRRVGGWRSPAFVHAGSYVLSDCVIALRPVDDGSFADLQSDLKENTGRLSAAYGGTGAKYITMRRLSLALADLGWRMHLRQKRPEGVAGECDLCALNSSDPLGL